MLLLQLTGPYSALHCTVQVWSEYLCGCVLSFCRLLTADHLAFVFDTLQEDLVNDYVCGRQCT